MSVNFFVLLVRILQVRTIYSFATFKTEYVALHNVPQPWCSHLWHKYLVCNYSEKIPMICLLDCYMTTTTLLCLILKFNKNIRMKLFKIILGLKIFKHSLLTKIMNKIKVYIFLIWKIKLKYPSFILDSILRTDAFSV